MNSACPEVLGGCPDVLGGCPDVLSGCPDVLSGRPDVLGGHVDTQLGAAGRLHAPAGARGPLRRGSGRLAGLADRQPEASRSRDPPKGFLPNARDIVEQT